ncbi:MAG: nucleotidyltransferase domain-containing protein [Desulfotomaculaceae bacterium]|nr:nucleotidyltransferase domain-containing protein [Desulfotomaculaceae bacterium]
MGALIHIDQECIKEQAANILKDFPQIAGAYLFGSCLGGCRPDSDIDIGLVLEDIDISERERAQLEASIRNSFYPVNGHTYDIVLLELNNPIFCFKVIKEGRLIYIRNIDRITDVMEIVSRRYADLYPRYRRALQVIIDEVIADGC